MYLLQTHTKELGQKYVLHCKHVLECLKPRVTRCSHKVFTQTTSVCSHTLQTHEQTMAFNEQDLVQTFQTVSHCQSRWPQTFLNKLPSELCHEHAMRTFQKTQESDSPSSLFWPSTVFWLSFLWASNNCAKYQQAIPPDTLTFQLSTLLSHKDALVLSVMDNLKQQRKRCRMKLEKRFNISVEAGDTSECIKQLWQQTANRFIFKKMQKTWR